MDGPALWRRARARRRRESDAVDWADWRLLFRDRRGRLSLLLVSYSCRRCPEESVQGTLSSGCHSNLSPEMADNPGGLSARAATESAISAAAGVSEPGDDQPVGGGDFGGQERGTMSDAPSANYRCIHANIPSWHR